MGDLERTCRLMHIKLASDKVKQQVPCPKLTLWER